MSMTEKGEIKDSKRLREELRGRTFGYVSAALGLVAGLAWNDAIRAAIEVIFPIAKDTVMVKFLYALLVTIAVVLLIRYIEKFLNRTN
jgi:hypothetical protein